MYFTEDEHLARQLQDELNGLTSLQSFKLKTPTKEKENMNPVDSILELIDPTPSIYDLFVRFDRKFFWNSLGMVQVTWSNKMTKCAGMCYFEGKRGLCRISLSAPLLSLRPRKDLVETLLHEMIHAYLFVTDNYRDREDHGPQFHKHMYRINQEAGTKITVYHSFFDEVQYYQKHIWRCNGPCQKKKPYFGFIRRAVNRPPGPSDPWWNQHKLNCNGTFLKISGPEEKAKKKRKNNVTEGEKIKDIRDFFTPHTSNIKTLADLKVNQPVSGVKSNNAGTLIVSNSKKSKDLNTIHSYVKSPQPDNSKKSTKVPSVKPPQANFSSTKEKSEPQEDVESEKVMETVRNIWANKFSNVKPKSEPPPKKLKLQCPVCSGPFLEEEIHTHVESCLENAEKKLGNFDKNPDSSISKNIGDLKQCPICSKKIVQSQMNEHLESCLNCSFVNEGENEEDEVKCESVPCPCCYQWFLEEEMNSHIDDCLTLIALKTELSS